jgi:predicted SnoaL-like aldol condensation-catalyzing enzyme
MELAPKYLTESYIQHNPNVAGGRAAFIEFFSRAGPPRPIRARITRPLVSIVAERDLVILVFAREYDDPKYGSKRFTTTWFDMFRIEHGKMAEHWGPALKR